jgi:hypothetical protein
MVAGSERSDEQRDGPRHEVGSAPHVLDGVAARTVDADDDDIGLELAHARNQILRAFETRQQAIASRRQPRFHDLGAGGIVVDQQDGEWLGQNGGLAAAPWAQQPCQPIKALFPMVFRLANGPTGPCRRHS